MAKPAARVLVRTPRGLDYTVETHKFTDDDLDLVSLARPSWQLRVGVVSCPLPSVRTVRQGSVAGQ